MADFLFSTDDLNVVELNSDDDLDEVMLSQQTSPSRAKSQKSVSELIEEKIEQEVERNRGHLQTTYQVIITVVFLI